MHYWFRFFRSALSLLVVTFLALWASSAAADNTGTQGGNGGQPFSMGCGPSEVLVGFGYTAGKALNQIQTLCANISDQGVVGIGGKIFPGPTVGSPAGHNVSLAGKLFGSIPYVASGPQTCPDQLVVKGIHVFVDSHSEVHNLDVICSEPNGSGRNGGFSTDTIGGDSTGGGVLTCPGGEVAVGIFGRAGGLVNQLGLRCNGVVRSGAANPKPSGTFAVIPGKHPEDTNGYNVDPRKFKQELLKNYTAGTPGGSGLSAGHDTIAAPADNRPAALPIDNGAAMAAANPSGATSGHTRTAAKDTTIYDAPEGKEIAYLSPGDDVIIVSCKDHGRGWCKISAPKLGYVWGRDLQ